MLSVGSTKRLIVVLVAGLSLSVFGAAVIKRQEKFADSPLLAAAIPLVTTTTAPPVTTTAPVAVTRPPRPVRAPVDSYAAEPIVEIGTIEIPKIGLSHRVMHGISLRNIDLGPSHWPGTAMPGEVGNTVFAGHRVTHTHPFLRINELVPGDLVIFHIGGLKSTYSVTGSEVVFPDNLSIVDQTDTATGTLFACHPPHSAKQRYVVHLALVDSVSE
jgi:sortase A